MLDLRIPTGWFFALAGVLLLAMGLFTQEKPQLTDVNVNLYCGVFMVAFGGVMLALAWRGRSQDTSSGRGAKS
jgi:uncharacterized membrane protein HdeD (DUF308 family)